MLWFEAQGDASVGLDMSAGVGRGLSQGCSLRVVSQHRRCAV
jgi:hypothetical protein